MQPKTEQKARSDELHPYLLKNAFTSHWGFQSYSTRPVWRAKQMEENNAKFDEFAKEVGFVSLMVLFLHRYNECSTFLLFFSCQRTTMQIHTTC